MPPSILSAQSGTDSSIIVPLLRKEDQRFYTTRMIGQRSRQQRHLLNDSLLFVGNADALSSDTTYGTFRANFLRYILDVMYFIYNNILRLQVLLMEYRNLLTGEMWSLINSLHWFPVDLDSGLKEVAVMSDGKFYSQTSVSSKSASLKFLPSRFNFLSDTSIAKSISSSKITEMVSFQVSRVANLPYKIGNLIFTRSLVSEIPYDHNTIEDACSQLTIPTSVLFILEMNPLVIPPPPEVPEPFLDADKKIIVPSKKEIQKALSNRAEWTLRQHSHKSSELIRICNETSKLLCWSAICGIREVIVYVRDSHGCWDNVERLNEMVKAQLSSMNVINTTVNILVPNENELVDFTEHLDTSKPLPDFSKLNSGGISDSGMGASNFSIPSPIAIEDDDNNNSADISPSICSPSNNKALNVILINQKTAYNPLLSLTESILQRETVLSSQVDSLIDNLRKPQLIIHCPRQRNFPSFLDGLPRFYALATPVFANLQTPMISFSAFAESLRGYSRSVHKNRE